MSTSLLPQQPTLPTLVSSQNKPHWKVRAIEHSALITDAWEVTKTYAGRLAEWVLFSCMIINIVEILPSVHLADWVSNATLGTQTITLDIAGFGLESMGEQAQSAGDEQAAKKAHITGWFLISLMIVTLLLVSLGILFPSLKNYTDNAEKGLILIRVIMTVIYGHVVHSLRHVTTSSAHSIPLAPSQAELAELLSHMKSELTQEITTQVAQAFAQQTSLLEQVAHNSSHSHPQVALPVAQVAHDLGYLHSQVALSTEQVAQEVATLTTPVALGDDDQAPDSAQESLHLGYLPSPVTHEVAHDFGYLELVAPPVAQVAHEVVLSPINTDPPEISADEHEPAARIKAFLEQWSKSKPPTIKQIMETCKVAKRTATRYRNDYFHGLPEGLLEPSNPC